MYCFTSHCATHQFWWNAFACIIVIHLMLQLISFGGMHLHVLLLYIYGDEIVNQQDCIGVVGPPSLFTLQEMYHFLENQLTSYPTNGPLLRTILSCDLALEHRSKGLNELETHCHTLGPPFPPAISLAEVFAKVVAGERNIVVFVETAVTAVKWINGNLKVQLQDRSGTLEPHLTRGGGIQVCNGKLVSIFTLKKRTPSDYYLMTFTLMY